MEGAAIFMHNEVYETAAAGGPGRRCQFPRAAVSGLKTPSSTRQRLQI